MGFINAQILYLIEKTRVEDLCTTQHFFKVGFLSKMTVLLAKLIDLKTSFSSNLVPNTRIGDTYIGVVYFANSTCMKSFFAGNTDAVKHSKTQLQIFSILEVELFGTN